MERLLHPDQTLSQRISNSQTGEVNRQEIGRLEVCEGGQVKHLKVGQTNAIAMWDEWPVRLMVKLVFKTERMREQHSLNVTILIRMLLSLHALDVQLRAIVKLFIAIQAQI